MQTTKTVLLLSLIVLLLGLAGCLFQPLQPPHTVSTPNTPTGPSSGEVGQTLTFSTGGASCSQGHPVEYRFDWGDGTYSSWSSSTDGSHSWSASGTYQVKAQARCATDTSVISGWSSARDVSITEPISPIPQDLYVDANNGSDVTGDGTQNNPYRTITKAISVAETDGQPHVIHLAPGIYNATLGEEFPISCSNITLVGETLSFDDVKIAGELYLYGTCTITNVSIYSNLHLYPEQPNDTISLENAYINATGVNLPCGVRVEGQGRVMVMSSLFENANLLMSGGSLTVENCTFSSGDIEAFFGDVSVQNTTLLDSWVLIRREAFGAIRDNVFQNGSRLSTLEEGHALAENNRFEGGATYNISVEHSSVLDLGGGPLGSSGQNTITGALTVNLLDLRPPYSGTLYAKNNTWDDPQPYGTVAGPIEASPNYSIKNEGNNIIFSD